MASEPKNDGARAPQADERVPVSYAEKAMSSLLRLHDELVEEKERRIDLYRRLMDREQQLAEVRAYVQLLEAELSRIGAGPNFTLSAAPHAVQALPTALQAAQAPSSAAPLDGPPAEAAPAGAEEAVEPADASTLAGPAPIVAWVPANSGKGGRR
ncbi:MAG TPA: hypothetical protein VN033_09515 [Vulgatibacter sp.]|nr:hypothetical protein [Vulgatibacter sp.]